MVCGTPARIHSLQTGARPPSGPQGRWHRVHSRGQSRRSLDAFSTKRHHEHLRARNETPKIAFSMWPGRAGSSRAELGGLRAILVEPPVPGMGTERAPWGCHADGFQGRLHPDGGPRGARSRAARGRGWQHKAASQLGRRAAPSASPRQESSARRRAQRLHRWPRAPRGRGGAALLALMAVQTKARPDGRPALQRRNPASAPRP